MRDATIQEINELANHPLIYPSTGLPVGTCIDMQPILRSRLHVALISKPGDMVFLYVRPHLFDCHFLFLPTGSGSCILHAAREMIREMFTNRGAHVITGSPPRENRAVRLMGRALGFTPVKNSEHTDRLGRQCMTYKLEAKECL